MSPLSPTVLTGATLVASPALWASLVDRTMPLDVALTRYLIALAVCWVLLSLVAELALPTPSNGPKTPVEQARSTDESSPPVE
ncbi:hypothetical protein EFK50_12835 [Nocardioides marmoriginsengisoli]|uniref:Uncharacterized protein n=1 Tax=Nocardioides marmoriginsengisoli TaxID=661483 RepID=A0A3N0CGS5_9ACTN|nr:hypothetical protein [Nocardioides marmoriginsengisoli]RNL62637.1 hypothetical protein EFK50_12835 [Nocardioides marmoriginsengisoli]